MREGACFGKVNMTFKIPGRFVPKDELNIVYCTNLFLT